MECNRKTNGYRKTICLRSCEKYANKKLGCFKNLVGVFWRNLLNKTNIYLKAKYYNLETNKQFLRTISNECSVVVCLLKNSYKKNIILVKCDLNFNTDAYLRLSCHY